MFKRKFIFELQDFKYEFYADSLDAAEDKILECLRQDCDNNHNWDRDGKCRACEILCDHEEWTNDSFGLMQCDECGILRRQERDDDYDNAEEVQKPIPAEEA